MATHVTPNAFQPPRKEKSKTADHLILEVSDSADSRASGEGKNRRKTKPTSRARRCHGFVASLWTWPLRLLVSRPSSLHATNCCKVGGAIFKGVVDATLGCLCASPTFTHDADAVLDSLPSPKKSQPMANIWPLMDASDEATGSERFCTKR